MHRIGAELPEHEIGLGGDHRAVEALEHVGDFFAVDAAIDHGDRAGREMLRELDLQPARIARGRRARAGARGRRRTDGDDGDRLAGRKLCATCGSGLAKRTRSSWHVAARRARRAPAMRQSDSRPRSAAAAIRFAARTDEIAASTVSFRAPGLTASGLERAPRLLCRLDHEVGQQSPNAIMHPLGDIKFFGAPSQVECARSAHNFMISKRSNNGTSCCSATQRILSA